jgi:hypothetical protein
MKTAAGELHIPQERWTYVEAVAKVYEKVKRWTKHVDLFSKEYAAL